MQTDLSSRTRTWYSIAMLLLLLGAAFFYFNRIDFGLPDFLYGDEGPRWIQARQIVNLGRRYHRPYYSPGWVYLLAGELKFLNINELRDHRPQLIGDAIDEVPDRIGLV